MQREHTAERRRQLKAAADKRYLRNVSGRYIIEGEDRPDRRQREWLMRHRWLDWWFSGGRMIGLEITAEGRSALAVMDTEDA